MNGAWAIRLALEDAGALASLRLVPGVEISITESAVWARSRRFDEAIDTLVRGLPVSARYAWLDDDLLREESRRIPAGTLPSQPWIPIADWLIPSLPRTATLGGLPDLVQLSLIRSSLEIQETLLLTRFDDWQDYASVASDVRLSQLTFALNEKDQVLVRGTPLPPLSGQRWSETEGVGIPAGYRWCPAVSATTLARVLGAGPHQLILWYPDGHAEPIHSEQFIPAYRSNVRASGRRDLTAP